MPLFRNKPRVIDAEQFIDRKNPPRGVNKTPTGYAVVTAQGIWVDVGVGEWIVKEDMPSRYYPIIDAGGVPKGYEPAADPRQTTEPRYHRTVGGVL